MTSPVIPQREDATKTEDEQPLQHDQEPAMRRQRIADATNFWRLPVLCAGLSTKSSFWQFFQRPLAPTYRCRYHVPTHVGVLSA